MKIIITMNGEGSRFKTIGFNCPKYEIIANDKALFEWSLLSLEDFFHHEFIFVARKSTFNIEFIEKILTKLNISKYSFIFSDELTDGQASTALLAGSLINDEESIAIYNIDTYISNGKIKYEDTKNCDGFIPSFIAEGDNWSFIKLDDKGYVSEVSEKVRISEYGTIGFYYFSNWKKYKEILAYNKYDIISKYKEAYIAPMYKYLLDDKCKVTTVIIDEKYIHTLGTPDEVEKFDPNYINVNNKLNNLI